MLLEWTVALLTDPACNCQVARDRQLLDQELPVGKAHWASHPFSPLLIVLFLF
jgi:hypothetical protein